MKKIVFSIFSLSIILLFNACSEGELKNFPSEVEMVADAKAHVSFISQDEFAKVLNSGEKIYLIDCREEVEFDSSCIKGAINIPRGLLEFTISDKVAERRAPVYIYCSDEKRSVLAAQILPKMKFSNVKVIESGFNTFKAKYPDLVQLLPAGDKSKSHAPAPSSGGCGG